jgi:hypothetical protein
VSGARMAGGGGAGGAGLMERRSFNFVMPTPVVKGPKLDDGGDGGDIGKNNRNGRLSFRTVTHHTSPKGKPRARALIKP